MLVLFWMNYAAGHPKGHHSKPNVQLAAIMTSYTLVSLKPPHLIHIQFCSNKTFFSAGGGGLFRVEHVFCIFPLVSMLVCCLKCVEVWFCVPTLVGAGHVDLPSIFRAYTSLPPCLPD